ncbi:hypothetical protein [Bradyrhizobium sp.]|uniref:hypothetical protein n=1 Tax=Bradyrhizobium sp. TaxID=376 RepID=UPI002384E992|nr:hypothetical protein [Bradyrhizobium sp.]MDE1935891.1 hypothetical protein [Bradyrhizobium sp.]
MDLDRFFTDENLARYRLLSSSTDVDQRRAVLKELADETAKLKSEFRRAHSAERTEIVETQHRARA